MDIKQVADLAALTLTPVQLDLFSSQLSATLEAVTVINELDTQDTLPTSQVTGLNNVTRPDVLNSAHILSQNQAISQAGRVLNGYIVVCR